jgi:2,3-bisphosphoglycerate-independent phosphoglycerate mutase
VPTTNLATSRTGILIILDGFGINPKKDFNAVEGAQMPNYRRLLTQYPHTQIEASEQNVGLPKGFMGNSEVGHLNLGAGRIVYQDFSLISKAIEDGSFFQNSALNGLAGKMLESGRKTVLHLMGLVSDGGVHSHISHLFALLQWAKLKGLKDVKIHVFTDGRDTSPTSAKKFVVDLESFCRDLGVGKIATVSGRFYSMDRDSRWERTEEAYQAMAQGDSERVFERASQYVEDQYQQGNPDEFILPAATKGYQGIHDGDGVIFFNFRADRARQITRAITQPEFTHFQRKRFPSLSDFVCLTSYDSSLKLPTSFKKAKVPQTLGEVVSSKGWKQLRIAETEKYAHVTYFFNGGEEVAFQGEHRILVPSPREVKTYDLKPEMSAATVTEKLLSEISTGNYQFVVVNFANPDMVGHTGNYAAAVRSLEALDSCLGKIVDWIESRNAFAILTADHGNCEMMQDESGLPMTAHTLLPVPMILIDPMRKSIQLKETGKLCDVAPTLLDLWGEQPPKVMTGSSMIQSFS